MTTLRKIFYAVLFIPFVLALPAFNFTFLDNPIISWFTMGSDVTESKIDEQFTIIDNWIALAKERPESEESFRSAKFEIVENVQVPCGKILMLSSSAWERAGYIAWNRNDWDLRADICVQMTAHRLWPQPFISDPDNAKVIQDTCKMGEMWRRLCDRAGLSGESQYKQPS